MPDYFSEDEMKGDEKKEDESQDEYVNFEEDKTGAGLEEKDIKRKYNDINEIIDMRNKLVNEKNVVLGKESAIVTRLGRLRLFTFGLQNNPAYKNNDVNAVMEELEIPGMEAHPLHDKVLRLIKDFRELQVELNNKDNYQMHYMKQFQLLLDGTIYLHKRVDRYLNKKIKDLLHKEEVEQANDLLRANQTEWDKLITNSMVEDFLIKNGKYVDEYICHLLDGDDVRREMARKDFVHAGMSSFSIHKSPTDFSNRLFDMLISKETRKVKLMHAERRKPVNAIPEKVPEAPSPMDEEYTLYDEKGNKVE